MVVGRERSRWPKHRNMLMGERDGDGQRLGMTIVGGSDLCSCMTTFRHKEDSIVEQDSIGNPEFAILLAAARGTNA